MGPYMDFIGAALLYVAGADFLSRDFGFSELSRGLLPGYVLAGWGTVFRVFSPAGLLLFVTAAASSGVCCGHGFDLAFAGHAV